MSDKGELQLLIIKQQERGGELDKKMANKCRLLQEAKDKKCKIMQKILQKELVAIRGKYQKGRGTERNPKEEAIYFTGNFGVGGEICTKCKAFIFILYYLIFKSVFTHRHVIYIYICYGDFVSFIFFF